MYTPTPAEIKLLRSKHRLSQHEFGQIVYMTGRTVRNWESGERNMPQALWELMLFKLDGVQPAPLVWVHEGQGALL